uniref:RNase H type-1 domain-containing protein n=1 Tax=Cannabis sativa TaxID=3483 RepID=A0A803Q8E1_CANSA
MADANLGELFEDAVQVTTTELTCDLHPGEVDQNEEPSRILLGKLYCCSRLGRKAIHGSLKNAWSSLTGWSWKEREDGLLQFTFQSKFDAENVLLRRPWVVCGYLLVLMPWPSWLTPAEVVFDHSPIWVRLRSIPPFYWNRTNLQELAGKVSSSYELPKHIERNFERGSFGMGTVRFRATVDVHKPLFSGFFLRRKGIKDLWIQYQYEKLPKLCFKCGALSHDQKFCFKTPTVIKDDKGAFYPMYGVWMGEEAVERSPFHLPLPSWFKEWITQKQLVKDPKMRNQVKTQRRWMEAEASECRKLRRQLPGKRRQVEVVTENRVETGEIVLNRFPAVYIPGTGEVTPFENTAEGVIEKVIPVRPLEKTVTSHATLSNHNSDLPATLHGNSDISTLHPNSSRTTNKMDRGVTSQPLHENGKFPKLNKNTLQDPSAMNPVELGDEPIPFSPGSSDNKSTKRKRGRPRKNKEPVSPSTTSTKRGKPETSKSWTGATPRSFKKKGTASFSNGKERVYRNLWNSNGIELAIDLDNKFVIVEKSTENHPTCAVPDILSWAPPPPSWLCCNSDVAISSAGSMLAAVFRDEWSNIIAIKTSRTNVNDPLLAEALAVSMAADEANSMGVNNIIFQSDNLNVVNEFQDQTSQVFNFRIRYAKARFANSCSKFKEWGIIHIPRRCNFMAHNIAKWATCYKVSGRISSDALPPAVLDDLIEWDPGL